MGIKNGLFQVTLDDILDIGAPVGKTMMGDVTVPMKSMALPESPQAKTYNAETESIKSSPAESRAQVYDLKKMIIEPLKREMLLNRALQ